MNHLDETRDEIRLSRAIVDRLQGRFRFSGSSMGGRGLLPVDVSATNEQLVLAGRGLNTFSTVAPGDDRVMHLGKILEHSQQLQPKDIVLLLLCGGMSFRTGGEIHPLMPFPDPNGGPGTSLLARQLNRLEISPLGQATCYIVGTPLNKSELEIHLASIRLERKYRVFTGGLAPTLSLCQPANSPPQIMRDPAGNIAYNPIGHLEALRWFVFSGALLESIKSKVVITASYSNWGRIFTSETLAIATMVERHADHDPRTLFLVEVTRMPSGREKGSILATHSNSSHDLRLIKSNYGRGEPCLTTDPNILLSTNTLYFSVPALLWRLQKALNTAGSATDRDSLLSLLSGAKAGARRDQLAAVFDAAFPIEAQLILTHTGKTEDFLRAERDLDQLTFLPGPSPVEAVEVGLDRAVFMKLPGDFKDPTKLTYLLES